MKKTSHAQVAHSHDHFFRKSLAHPQVAQEFLAVHLPKEIYELLSIKSLRLQPRSYINDTGKESIADVLFKAKIAGQLSYVYLLLEHQSTPDELMPFRLFKYTCNIIDDHLKTTKKKKLPFVYPIVVYHGKQPYPFTNNIHDLVDAPRALVDQYFLKPFHLLDLNKVEDEELKQNLWSGTLNFALKYIWARDLLLYIKEMAKNLYRLDQLGGRDYISTVLQYFIARGQIEDKDELLKVINTEISVEVGENIMTLGEKLLAEGMKKGLEKGLKEKYEIAARMLAEGLRPSFIAKMTKLPLSKIKLLQKKH